MSRKPTDDDGSLDLLLDTICNTFGGVLFISMLVVVLLNMTSSEAATTPAGEASQTDLIEWETRLAQVQDKLDQLETSIEQQQQIEEQIVDPELKDKVGQYRRSQARNAELLQQRSNNLGEMAQSQQRINDLTQQLQENEQQMENTQQNLAAIQAQLDREIESRTRAAKLPKARRSEKAEIVFALRGGRLTTYFPPYLEEFAEKQDDEGAYIEPVAGAGLAIAPGMNTDQLDRRLNEFDSNTHHLTIFVWPDSYAEFAIVKDRLVSNRFEYALEPLPEGEKLRFGEEDQARDVQ